MKRKHKRSKRKYYKRDKFERNECTLLLEAINNIDLFADRLKHALIASEDLSLHNMSNVFLQSGSRLLGANKYFDIALYAFQISYMTTTKNSIKKAAKKNHTLAVCKCFPNPIDRINYLREKAQYYKTQYYNDDATELHKLFDKQIKSALIEKEKIDKKKKDNKKIMNPLICTSPIFPRYNRKIENSKNTL
jgi:hypothetical protein